MNDFIFTKPDSDVNEKIIFIIKEIGLVISSKLNIYVPIWQKNKMVKKYI